MAYLSGFSRRYGKRLMPWMQAHLFPAGGLSNHPMPEDMSLMWKQMEIFQPDAIIWLGYSPAGKTCTFPMGNAASWESAARIHAEFKSMPPPKKSRPPLAIVRPYSARAVVCETAKGIVHPADVLLREFARMWSCDLGQRYDVFEVPPYETKTAKDRRTAELKRYERVVSSVDWPGATNIAKGYENKVLSPVEFNRIRAKFRKIAEKWVRRIRK